MKVIDLLNKIANGEEVPKRIKYRYHIYEYEDGYDFVCDELEHRYFAENYCNDYEDLNSEIETIEEDKKIEKLGYSQLMVCPDLDSLKEHVNERYEEVRIKINKIIDILNKEE